MNEQTFRRNTTSFFCKPVIFCIAYHIFKHDVMKNKSPSAELVFNRENGMMKRTSGSKVVSSRSGSSSRSIMMLLILTVVRVSNCSGAAL